MGSHGPYYQQARHSSHANLHFKRSQTNCDMIGEKETTRSVSTLDSRNSVITLKTPSSPEATRFFVYKHNAHDPYRVYDIDAIDPTIRVVKDDLSNVYKSNFLESIMGVKINNCEVAYYCIYNNTVVASMTIDTLTHTIRLVSKAFYVWEIEEYKPNIRRHRRRSSSIGRCVSHECLSEVMTCMGIGSPPSVSSFNDLTGLTILSPTSKPSIPPPTIPHHHPARQSMSYSNLALSMAMRTLNNKIERPQSQHQRS